MSIIDGLLNQSIEEIYKVDLDKFADETRTVVYRDVPCRWQEIAGEVITNQADKATYQVKAWIHPHYVIELDYIVKKDSKLRKVIGKETHINLAGEIDHIVLLIA